MRFWAWAVSSWGPLFCGASLLSAFFSPEGFWSCGLPSPLDGSLLEFLLPSLAWSFLLSPLLESPDLLSPLLDLAPPCLASPFLASSAFLSSCLVRIFDGESAFFSPSCLESPFLV